MQDPVSWSTYNAYFSCAMGRGKHQGAAKAASDKSTATAAPLKSTTPVAKQEPVKQEVKQAVQVGGCPMCQARTMYPVPTLMLASIHIMCHAAMPRSGSLVAALVPIQPARQHTGL